MDYCAMQWGDRSITRLIGRPELVKGYAYFNESLLFAFEASLDDIDTGVLQFQDSKRLLSMGVRGEQSQEPTSLLNFNNAKFLSENLKDYTLIAARFKITEA